MLSISSKYAIVSFYKVESRYIILLFNYFAGNGPRFPAVKTYWIIDF